MALTLEQAALLSTPTPADLSRSTGARISWLVEVIYSSPAASTRRLLGRHPDGLPFHSRQAAEQLARAERGQGAPRDASVTATVIPVTPPDPLEASHG